MILRVANFWQPVSLATDTLSPCTPAPRPPSTPSTSSVLPWHTSTADFGILPPLRHRLPPVPCLSQLPACELLHSLANMQTNLVRWTLSCNISPPASVSRPFGVTCTVAISKCLLQTGCLQQTVKQSSKKQSNSRLVLLHCGRQFATNSHRCCGWGAPGPGS